MHPTLNLIVKKSEPKAQPVKGPALNNLPSTVGAHNSSNSEKEDAAIVRNKSEEAETHIMSQTDFFSKPDDQAEAEINVIIPKELIEFK